MGFIPIGKIKGFACPICGKQDWCMISEKGDAALCQRVYLGSRGDRWPGGWYHLLEDHPVHHKPPPKPKPVPKITDWETRYEKWEGDGLPELGEILGVSIRSLVRARAGFNGIAWTFPMFDMDKMIGVRVRYSNGHRRSIPGSCNGLFVPDGLTLEDPLLLPEGPSDTCAALDLGFDAVGRFNCNGGIELIQRFLKQYRRHVVIVADNDQPKKDGRRPGQEGASTVAKAILPFTKSVTVIKPPKHKDLRDWFLEGAKRADIERLIKNTQTIYNRP